MVRRETIRRNAEAKTLREGIVEDGRTQLFEEAPPESDYDYASQWRLRWRHTRHVAIVCQLVVMLPTLITAFFGVAPFVT